MRDRPDFRFIERIMIQHAHPAKLITDISGVIIGWYFLWIHNLVLALVAIFGASVVGTLLVWKQDVAQLYQTQLGHWMIGQAKPINLIIRSVGFTLVCLGFWFHSFLYFPLGIVLIVAARFLGNNAQSPHAYSNPPSHKH